MKLILAILVVLSFSVEAQPSLLGVNEFQLEYEVSGKGRYTVLLEAGGGAGMSDWDPVFNRMAEHARVIRYSRVGNGKSTKIKKHFTSSDYAGLANELLIELNVKQPVIFIAHSYGGSIARDFAATYPRRVAALLMLDPSSEHDVDIMRSIDLEKGNREISQIKLDDMAGGMSNQYLDFWSKRPLPDYPEIKDMPVTVISSVRKTKNPANLFFTNQGRKLWGELWQNWTSAFPQGRAVLTEKSGHYVQFDEPELVASELLLLMRKLDKH